MSMDEEAIRNAVFSVDGAFRGYWLNADELVDILGLQGHLGQVVRSLKKIQRHTEQSTRTGGSKRQKLAPCSNAGA